MLTGELRSQVDSVWMAFFTGGIANPLEVVEQIDPELSCVALYVCPFNVSCSVPWFNGRRFRV